MAPPGGQTTKPVGHFLHFVPLSTCVCFVNGLWVVGRGAERPLGVPGAAVAQVVTARLLVRSPECGGVPEQLDVSLNG